MSRMRCFSCAKDYWKRSRSAKSSLRNDEPIIVYPGTDSIEDITSSLPSAVLNIIRREDIILNRDSWKSCLDQWTTICESIFGQRTNLPRTLDITAFPNPMIDKARAEAEERLKALAKQNGIILLDEGDTIIE